MSHTIYTTDAIIIHSVSTGEADTTIWLLTAELGLIVARAQGARKQSGKMRSHLQLFSVLSISLVRGKYLWRITGAEAYNGSSIIKKLNSEALNAFARISIFVRRMTITDTQSIPELFDTVIAAREKLGLATISKSKIAEIELITIAKILVSLGYIIAETILKIENKEISYSELARVVNNAIVESHL